MRRTRHLDSIDAGSTQRPEDPSGHPLPRMRHGRPPSGVVNRLNGLLNGTSGYGHVRRLIVSDVAIECGLYVPHVTACDQCSRQMGTPQRRALVGFSQNVAHLYTQTQLMEPRYHSFHSLPASAAECAQIVHDLRRRGFKSIAEKMHPLPFHRHRKLHPRDNLHRRALCRLNGFVQTRDGVVIREGKYPNARLFRTFDELRRRKHAVRAMRVGVKVCVYRGHGQKDQGEDVAVRIRGGDDEGRETEGRETAVSMPVEVESPRKLSDRSRAQDPLYRIDR